MSVNDLLVQVSDREGALAIQTLMVRGIPVYRAPIPENPGLFVWFDQPEMAKDFATSQGVKAEKVTCVQHVEPLE